MNKQATLLVQQGIELEQASLAWEQSVILLAKKQVCKKEQPPQQYICCECTYDCPFAGLKIYDKVLSNAKQIIQAIAVEVLNSTNESEVE